MCLGIFWRRTVSSFWYLLGLSIAASVVCRAANDVTDDCRRFCTRLANPNRSLLCETPRVKQLFPPSSTPTIQSHRSFRRVFCDRAEIWSGAVRRYVPPGYSTTLSCLRPVLSYYFHSPPTPRVACNSRSPAVRVYPRFCTR